MNPFEMTSGQDPFHPILRHIHSNYPQDDPALISVFINAFIRFESQEELKEHLRKGLPHYLTKFWDLVRQRRPGQIALHVFSFEIPYEDGAVYRRTIIQIVHDDMPFLVDSLLAALESDGRRVKALFHPVLCTQRDPEGSLHALSPHYPPPQGFIPESCIQIELKGTLHETELKELERKLHVILTDVGLVVTDWPLMRQKTAEVIQHLEKTASSGAAPADDVQELIEFVKWMDNHHSTCLGYREFTGPDAQPSTQMGLLRSEHAPDIAPAAWDAFTSPKDFPHALAVRRSRCRSTVHRPDRMYVVDVRQFDAAGNLALIRQYIGLPPSPTNSRSPRDVPFLRRKIHRMIENSGFIPQGYSSKALVQVLEQFPHEELLLADDTQILNTALSVLRHHDRRHVAVFYRFDEYSKSLNFVIFINRDRYTAELEETIGNILQSRISGVLTESRSYLNEFSHALLHYKLDVDVLPSFELTDLEQQITAASLTWGDHLHDLLVAQFGEDVGSKYTGLYSDAFPEAYQHAFTVGEALRDIVQIELLRKKSAPHLHEHDVGTALRRGASTSTEAEAFYLKLFHKTSRIPLSDILPVLDHLDFSVAGEIAYKIDLGSEDCYWIQDFHAAAHVPAPLASETLPQRFHDAFLKIQKGLLENDGFNRLILRSRLTCEQINILRAYSKYLKQAGCTFSQTYIEEVLTRNVQVAELLVAYFEARFDPESAGHERAETYLVAIQKSLENITSPDDDRILRRFLNLLTSTLRCNVYQRQQGLLKDYIAFKFDGRAVMDLPDPRPLYEIFVYSPRLEAVHLRGSKVARGGIRWSDRREDFRTEILGLLKAQIVKNAVIVPGGSKGGFVVKRTLSTPEDQRAEVIACYITMMRGLLDLTDNLVDGHVQHPKETVCYDGEDSYLVVAADKGTATFSDIANGIAKEYGFWLGDAFASGGSSGYDHKKLAITARGAWESVRHHFAELAINADTQPLRVIGVGDMSGDVFGNGMLMSPHIHLVGAFNHQHIFVDPNPDSAAGFAERQRLFTLARSSWSDYTPEKISEGGGVFSRGDKWIPVTAQMRTALGLDHAEERLTPSALMQALLKAPVELVWFGGIGTFIKAQQESHHDVGDRSNDSVRVNGNQMRCQVIAEGANLGVTQAGRIEFAAHGGRINTDAIDNSAGVDCSDHEVNIKILFSSILQAGRIKLEARDQRLEAMKDDVAQLVLRDNYLQNKLISYEETQGHRSLEFQARLIRQLEQKHALDRAQAQLPDDTEIARRLAAQKDLTRPEIAVLLAHTKIGLCEELLLGQFSNDPDLHEVLLHYFPEPVRRDFPQDVVKHPLRREIVTTCLVNEWVNRLGLTFIFRVAEATGASLETIARALHTTIMIHDIATCWAGIDALDGILLPTEQRELLNIICVAVRRSVHWLIRQRSLLRSAENGVMYKEAFQGLFGHLHESLCPEDRKAYATSIEKLIDKKVPQELAQHISTLRFMGAVLDIVPVAQQYACSTTDAAAIYFHVGDHLGFDWARATLESIPIIGHWQRTSRSLLHEDLTLYQSLITRAILGQPKTSAEEKFRAWQTGQTLLFESMTHLLQHMRTSKDLNLSSIDVLARRLRQLAEA